MGRLNYTNRRSEGPKIGQVCFKDLVKRISPGSGFKAALRDPVIDLDISGKNLGDPGLLEVAQGVEQTYESNTGQQVILRLEEFNISQNDLTPNCLGPLANAIRLACNDLQDLDLSDNNLCIVSQEDLRAWEAFLASISRCCKLRRLDLHGNEIGLKAFEALARIYGQEQPVDLILPQQLAADLEKLHSLTSNFSLGSPTELTSGPPEDDPKKGSRRGSRHVSKSPEKPDSLRSESPHLAEIYATTKGLRSIPYIDLSETSLDDCSALYLSYIIANHLSPEQLLSRVPAARPGPQAQQLETYDLEPRCKGMIYLPNQQLGAPACRVLDLAERLRCCSENLADEGDNQDSQQVTERMTPTTPSSGLPHVHRRHLSSTLGDDTQESIATDLHRARSRLQISTIEKYGHRNNDLWAAALKMLVLSRSLQPQRRIELPRPAPIAPALKPKQLIVRTLDIPLPVPKQANPNPWGLPLTPKSTNMSIPSRTRTSKDSTTSNLPSSTPSADRRKTPAQKTTTTSGYEYRSTLPCGFPGEIWRRILAEAVGATGLLSPGQQRSVLIYGMDRKSLRKEREALGQKEAVQVWHVLDDMDCLAYEMRC